MRGDRPSTWLQQVTIVAFTPHARGSTLVPDEDIVAVDVYPACAGIDPSLCRPSPAYAGLPRMRGDRPTGTSALHWLSPFTPHARGSTSKEISGGLLLLVYPACAGIDLGPTFHPPASACLPRMRGDRPVGSVPTTEQSMFTPHARGSTSGGRYPQ